MAINQLQKGSTLERQTIMAKLRRMKKTSSAWGDTLGALLHLESWLKGREPRTKKKPGGL